MVGLLREAGQCRLVIWEGLFQYRGEGRCAVSAFACASLVEAGAEGVSGPNRDNWEVL